ncbi:synaptonemal complex protein 1-like isoform X4 [Molothrus ater]|uniref:synaptonemal complex protein 1-like isoform X4 n=1 Tax=Molothrus ater TaxID=84834 RepID=UPI0023E76072|nr:synaptonemal complex protein 1-like isoform X4 [Molothrus ater]
MSDNLQQLEFAHVDSKLFILQKEIQDLKAQLTSTAEKEQDYLKQLVTLKTDLEQEALRNEQLTVYLSKLSLEKEQTAQEKNAVAAEVKKLQEQQEDSKKKEENTKQLVENLEEANSQLRNELESLKEKMAKTGEEMRSALDEREENMNNLKKQVENKTKCIEELQQENKVLPKKLTAESKKSNTYEGKVNKLQIEMENMNKQHKEAVDIYQKDIETRKGNENKLREEENELSSLKSELASIREQLKAEIEEKENLVKEHSHSMILESEKKHKTYAIKTPPMDKMHSGRSTNLPSEQSSRKKQKVLVQLDTQSDSSEHTDLLSIVSEEEMFKNLYKDYPQASQLHSTAPKKLHPV